MAYTLNVYAQASVLQPTDRFLGSMERSRFEQTLADLQQEGKPRLVIDLSGIDFMDSAGVGLLTKGARTLRAVGGDVRLACMQERIQNLFVTARLLGRVFVNHPTVEAALRSFDDDPQPTG